MAFSIPFYVQNPRTHDGIVIYAIEYIFPVYIASSNHKGGFAEFETVMHVRDSVQDLHSVPEFSQPLSVLR